MPSVIALVPARAGSERVKHKNIRPLAGHPLIAYAISTARASKIFDRVLVSTDSQKIADIACYYGADVPFIRPAEYATAVSPDIEWIKHALSNVAEQYEAFAILRPTSPFRGVQAIQRAWNKFVSLKNVDSLRAVELCRQHPGKTWVIEGEIMRPLLDQSHLEVAWHARQYQDMPKVYIQNSALEIAWTRVVWETNSREGRVVAPFLTERIEGFSIDYEEDWTLAECMIERGEANLPKISGPPYGAIQ